MRFVTRVRLLSFSLFPFLFRSFQTDTNELFRFSIVLCSSLPLPIHSTRSNFSLTIHNALLTNHSRFPLSPSHFSPLIAIKYIKKYRATSLRINRTKRYIYSDRWSQVLLLFYYYNKCVFFFCYFISAYHVSPVPFVDCYAFRRRRRRDLRVKEKKTHEKSPI